MNPKAPKTTSANDEILKYNLRKGAGMALGGAALNTQPATMSKSSKPPIKKRKKKKKVQGGC